MDTRGSTKLAACVVVLVALTGGCSKSDDGAYRPNPAGSSELASGNIGAGGNFSHAFPTAGAFPYHCGLHPTIMFGASVVVSDTAAATSAAVQIVGVSTPGFSPATVSIKTGGTVTWTNADGMTHSVESD